MKHILTLGSLAALAPAAALADPGSSSPVAAALDWPQGTLLGNVATIVALFAAAVVGCMMFTGRINWRIGATVIVGWFVLFGSGAIESAALAVR